MPFAPGEISRTMRSKIKMHTEGKGDEIWESCRSVRACVRAHLMDECFNFPPLESLMGDEPKVACKVRRTHQTHRQDGGETGTPAERKAGRWRGQEV